MIEMEDAEKGENTALIKIKCKGCARTFWIREAGFSGFCPRCNSDDVAVQMREDPGVEVVTK